MRSKTDYKFTKGFKLSLHASERLEERSRFSQDGLIRALTEKRYAKLDMKKKPNYSRSDLKDLIEKSGLSFGELVLNSVVSFEALVYLLVWSTEDDNYFVLVLKEVLDCWLILTILPATFLEEYSELYKQSSYNKARTRMLREENLPAESQPGFKRYHLVVMWTNDEMKQCVKIKNIKLPIESYSSKEDFIEMAQDVTDGGTPERIIVRSRTNIDDVYLDLLISEYK